MATHDYVIANGTGSAVRSDLNNALAAIVSNNSGSSEPSTKYAYQWWADTTTGQLKLRNSANNGWVTIFELDGTMLMEDGSAASPGLAFASDLNSGFFSGGADKINFATGGVERLEIGSSEVVFNDPSNDVDFRVESNGNTHMLFVDGGNDRVGIGTASPVRALQIGTHGSGDGEMALASSTTGNCSILMGDGASGTDFYRGYIQYQNNSDSLIFATSVAERMRIDSSGRLLVGTSNAVAFGSRQVLAVANGATGGVLSLYNSTTATANTRISSNPTGSEINDIGIHAASTNGSIIAYTNNDTERLRVDSSGRLGVGTSAPSAQVESEGSVSSTTQFSGFQGLRVQNTNGAAFGVTADINFVAGTASGNRGAAIGVEYMSGNKNDLYFATSGGNVSSTDTLTERMRIDSAGQHLIFSVGNPITSGTSASAGTSNDVFTGLHSRSSTTSGGTVCVHIFSNGNIQNTNNSYSQISDVKLKENIVDANSQWDDLKAVQVRNFNFKAETGHSTHTQIGVVAQEIEVVSPGLVYETPDRDAEGEDLGTVTKAVSYSVLYMKAIKALQEAMTRIETLETEVAALKAG
jgi:hypothetical protein